MCWFMKFIAVLGIRRSLTKVLNARVRWRSLCFSTIGEREREREISLLDAIINTGKTGRN